MWFTVVQSTDRKGNPEFFATGDFKNPEGVYVPYSRWLNPSEINAYLENPESIDEIMDDYRLTAFKLNERSTSNTPNPFAPSAAVAKAIVYSSKKL